MSVLGICVCVCVCVCSSSRRRSGGEGESTPNARKKHAQNSLVYITPEVASALMHDDIHIQIPSKPVHVETHEHTDVYMYAEMHT